MKSILIFLLYIFGFLLFYNLLSYLKADEYFYSIFHILKPNNNKKYTNNTPNKSEETLTPEGSKKSLRLTKQEIGRHTWALLHSIAASYPIQPTETDKQYITKFMFGLAKSFPCKVCGNHLLKLLEKKGVKNGSREELVQYMCEIHNIVNRVLNKEEFNCEKINEVWGGDCGCNE